MKETSITELIRAHAEGAVVLDVRETDEYVEGHVPGAIHVPLAMLPIRIDQVPAADPVYVICRSGHRSQVGAEVLAAQGRTAVSVAGGTMGWIQAGQPIVTGSERG